MRIVAHGIRRKANDLMQRGFLEPMNSNRVDDRADKVSVNDFDWCAETLSNRVLREIAFAPEGIPQIQDRSVIPTRVNL